MSGVKRYDPLNSDGTCGVCVEDSDYGAYVEYADYDQLHAANQRLEGEVARLREALHVILNEVDGNLTPTIRDLVNRAAGVNNGTHPNELYAYCETIESAAHTALSTANGEVTE